jgi:hypothetical protein
MARSNRFVISSSLPVALVLQASSLATAQNTYQWSNPSGGAWSTTSNWSPAVVPNDRHGTAVLALSGGYTVSRAPMYGELLGVQVLNPMAVLWFEGDSSIEQNVLHVNEGGIVNHGMIQLGSDDGADVMGVAIYMAGGSHVTGTGMIRLMDETSQLRSVSGSSAMFYNNLGHVIAGTGTIKDVHNLGEIVADVPGEQLIMSGVNGGTIRVKNGAEALVTTLEAVVGNGKYIIEGADAVLRGFISHGEIVAFGHPHVQANLTNVVSSSTFTLSGYLGGEVHNDGAIDMHSVVRLQSANILGDGEIVLTGRLARLLDSGFERSAIGAGQLVKGEGEIVGLGGYVPRFLKNAGVIRADVSGKQLNVQNVENVGLLEACEGGVLVIRPASAFSFDNRGVVAARSGATVLLNGLVEQRDGGHMYADGGTLRCEFDFSTVRGGSIFTIGNGLIDVARRLRLADVEISGNWDVSGPLVISSGSTVHNVTTLRSLDPINRRMAIELGSGCRVEGIGEIVLGSADRHAVYTRATLQPAIIGRDQTIRGVGTLGDGVASGTMHIEGTLKPGLPIGALSILQRVTLADSAVLEVELADDAHDRMDVHHDLVLGGKLRIAFLGKLPEPCSEVRIIAATGAGTITATFAELELPQMPLGRLAVRYDPDAVILVYNPADHDGSTFVDTDDFTAFVADFEAGNESADINHSGVVDTDDFTDFVAAFEQGC